MSCWQMRILISEYVDGELSDEEKQKVEDHIVVCGACYREFVEMKTLVGKLKRALAPYRFTDRDKQTLLRRLQSEGLQG